MKRVIFERSKKALPCLMMSVMLAAPAMSAHAATSTTATTLSVSRKPAASAGHRKPMAKSSNVHVAAWQHRNSVHLARNHRNMRREPAVMDSFVNDRAAYDPDRAAFTAAHVEKVAFSQSAMSTWQQTGMASWYGGSRWHGHATSSGARYDQEELTAAHASLPMGSRVRVVRNDTGRSVVVVINDRPGTRTRIIDLSRAAARELGILDRGIAMVTLAPAPL